MSLVLPLAAAAALLFMGGSKAKPKPKARARPRPRVIPQGMARSARSAPRTAPKSAPKGRVTLGPVRVIKRTPAKATRPSSLTAPLARAPSQGGSPPLAAPLSADIPTDQVSPVAQRAAPTPRSQPGYQPTVARRSASAIANHLRRAGKAKYDRRFLKQWQTQAGLKADGLYGPATRGALVFYGAKDPPAAFAGSGTVPFRPPV